MQSLQSADAETVSVIVAVYNGERYLAEALQSIVRQSVPAMEILVVDDGSTDESARIAAEFSVIRVLSMEHRGVSAALNLGIRHASGSLLAILDADDRWLPDKSERQLNTLRQRPELDMVFGHVRQFTARPTENGMKEVVGAPQPAVHKSSMLIRRTAFDRVGWFSEGKNLHDFLDWYARASESGCVSVVLPEVVFERRVHEHNYGRTDASLQQQSYFKTLRAAIHRRQAS